MTLNTDPKFEYLTQEQIDKFHRDGYLVICGFLETSIVAALLNRSKELLAGFDIDSHPLTRFTTGDNDHVGDDYFLTSSDKIRFFLEQDVLDEDGKLTRPKEKAVNKIGHGLHELDPLFRKVTLENQRIKQLVRDLKFHRDPHFNLWLSRNSNILVEKVVHPLDCVTVCHLPCMIGELWCDYSPRTYRLYTEPPSALGFWIPLEKCTAENGALSFLPGSHLTTPISKRFVRLPTGGTGFEQLPASANSSGAPPLTGRYVLECCEPGDLVLIHGSVLHKSEKNRSPNTRFAYTFHMIESLPYATYDEKNWLQPTKEMPFSRILA